MYTYISYIDDVTKYIQRESGRLCPVLFVKWIRRNKSLFKDHMGPH